MSVRDRNYDKTLQEWATKWKSEHLTPEVVKLLSQANYDLWYGPINDGSFGDLAEGDEELQKYPGFTTATRIIAQALTSIPSDLYVDADSGEVLDHAPEEEKCQSCDGEGTVGDDDPTHLQVRKETCTDCNGRGAFEAPGDWWHVERPDILKVIVGKELSEYIR
jgi:hypothetical protein